MRVNVNYSSMFSNFGISSKNSSSTSSLYSMLGDYSSIQRGSYGKLMKAYYSDKHTSGSKNHTTETDKKENVTQLTDKRLSLVKGSADDLKTSANKLTATGEKSLFGKEETTVTDDMYKAVSNFVSDYNDTIKATANASSTSVNRNTSYAKQMTNVFSRSLSQTGITINADQTLSLDEKKFKESDLKTVKTLFNGESSYASMIAQRADMIGKSAVNSATGSGFLYGGKGTYSAFQTTSGFEWFL